MIVSRTGSARRIRATSLRAAASMASVAPASRCSRPAARTRACGAREARAHSIASTHFPAAASSRARSESPTPRARHQNAARSRTIASDRTEHTTSGIITGPPFASVDTTADSVIG